MKTFDSNSERARCVIGLIIESDPPWICKFGPELYRISEDNSWITSVFNRLDPNIDWIDTIEEVASFFYSIDSYQGYACSLMLKPYLRQFSIETLLSIEARYSDDTTIVDVAMQTIEVLIENVLSHYPMLKEDFEEI